uniref:Uncharacterized protein n=1 Tax=Otus sunia TaxID=257818 RepID=A0A8C8E5V2_9STRI
MIPAVSPTSPAQRQGGRCRPGTRGSSSWCRGPWRAARVAAWPRLTDGVAGRGTGAQSLIPELVPLPGQTPPGVPGRAARRPSEGRSRALTRPSVPSPHASGATHRGPPGRGCCSSCRASQPAPEHPVTEHPVTEHPAPEHPVTEHPVTEHPAPEHPVTEHPVTEHPAPEHPVTEHPAPEHPAPEHPALSRPAPVRQHQAVAGLGASAR